ncbi:hypothetical protein CPT_Moonbeam154 [Bacillus phage Moonbeam]|uniref:Uncharacterized protein n=1 Tax=Bacillus phage Moonbeam TaxID=1540091 RepID=A0A0A0RNH2_9CAUD|nr:hypothetical protein CPT_Moonbeam154 [Bacillus phage Moonbeam]AIW03552.1 hypothetical protein CPT_Moonbeam154 [Bacillus phage Moonbeam]
MSGKKKKDYNYIKRSQARGANARGHKKGVVDVGKDAINISKKSNKGFYYIKFTKQYGGVSERDVELRNKYAKDLLSAELAVPTESIVLKQKSKPVQTLTSLDIVYYVKVGAITAGKLSIRVQRLWKSINLLYVYQEKGKALKPVKKGLGSIQPYKKKTKSQIVDQANKADRKRKDGKY